MSSNSARFLNGCYVQNDPSSGAATLVSFDAKNYGYFVLMVVAAGPLLHRIVASGLNLERHYKSIIKFHEDITNNLIYSFVLFVLGNYSHTFDWVVVLFFVIGLVGFTVLVELPVLKVSLPVWRTWGFGAWVFHIVGLLAILVAAAWHIKWAADFGIIGWYLGLFGLATMSIWGSILINRIHSWFIRKYPNGSGFGIGWRRSVFFIGDKLVLFIAKPKRKTNASQHRVHNQTTLTDNHGGYDSVGYRLERAGTTGQASQKNVIEDAASGVGGSDTSNGSLESLDSNYMASSDIPLTERNQSADHHRHPHQRFHPNYLNYENNLHNIPRIHYGVHLHHWQIFYILAFFTRFDIFVSRMCAGIVLGIYVHGIAAYGFDPLLNPN